MILECGCREEKGLVCGDDMCEGCASQVGRMFNEYAVRGTHNVSGSDLCCEEARALLIPLTGWEKL